MAALISEVLGIKVRAVLVGFLAVAASATTGSASAVGSATPVETGCPAGYERLSVTWFEATGPYFLPRRVDSAGNNNGYVCAKVQPDSVRDASCMIGALNACLLAQLGLPVYLFTDDDNPAYK